MTAKRVLIIDDSAAIRQMARWALTAEGYDLVEAQDGVGAIVPPPEPVHLVITGLHTQATDGAGLIRALRAMEEYARVPILMLATESQEWLKQEAKAAGATGWILKPFTPLQLLAVVRRVIG